MNRLSLARRTQIIGALVEGNSIRSTERMTNNEPDRAPTRRSGNASWRMWRNYEPSSKASSASRKAAR
jgi:hypothetical protein